MRSQLPFKCSKPNPADCRLHRGRFFAARAKLNKAYALEAERIQQLRNQERMKQVNADLDANLKPRTDRSGRTTVSVFRAGPVVETPKRQGEYVSFYEQADEMAPAGRHGRMQAVFASPTVGGVNRWVEGVASVRQDPKVHELRIDPDKTYLYSVEAWERASWTLDASQTPRLMGEYWASGMTMSQWIQRVRAGEVLDPEQYELLLPFEDVLSAKPVSDERVVRWNLAGTDAAKARVLRVLRGR